MPVKISERDLAGSGPDFLCVGAQKAGTGWLYQQLRDHPDFWMPPMKELHYFDRLVASAEANGRTLPFARNEHDRLRIARERSRDQKDHEFLDRLERLCRQDSVDLDGYADLFELKGDLIAGDITPGYSILSESAVEKIALRFRNSKVLFIARDPVERAWSQLSMYVRRGLIEPFDPEDLAQITTHLQRPEIRARSYPTETVRRWRRNVNPDRFRVYFFDDLTRDPATLRNSVIEFLGGDPNKSSGGLPPGYNAKAEKQKLSFTESARQQLAHFFEAELRACAAELGGPATGWPKRYGL